MEIRILGNAKCIRVIPIGTQLTNCPGDVDGRDGGCMCTAHAIECCIEGMENALADGDAELYVEYTADLERLSVKA